MKKLLLCLALVLLVFANEETRAVSFDIKGGLNLSNIDFGGDEGKGLNDHSEVLPGFHLGAAMDIPLKNNFSIETGLFMTTKGNKIEYALMGADYESTLSLYYIDIPITPKYTYNFGDFAISGAIGPYVGIGLSGKAKSETFALGQKVSEEEDIEFGDGDDDMKRLDYGLSFGLGFEYKSILFGFSYDLGLQNLSNVESLDTKHRVIKFSLGYSL